MHARLSLPPSLIELINLAKTQRTVICLIQSEDPQQQKALLVRAVVLPGAERPWAAAQPLGVPPGASVPIEHQHRTVPSPCADTDKTFNIPRGRGCNF